jgi:hypothetical protein
MVFQERRARMFFTLDSDEPDRSANTVWVTLPFA